MQAWQCTFIELRHTAGEAGRAHWASGVEIERYVADMSEVMRLCLYCPATKLPTPSHLAARSHRPEVQPAWQRPLLHSQNSSRQSHQAGASLGVARRRLAGSKRQRAVSGCMAVHAKWPGHKTAAPNNEKRLGFQAYAPGSHSGSGGAAVKASAYPSTTALP